MVNTDVLKHGFLLAFGEMFLKSRGVESIMRKRLIDNAVQLFKNAGITYKVHLLRERIFVESTDAEKTGDVLKGLFGISWFSEAYFFRNRELSDIQKFIKAHWRDWIGEKETFAMRIGKSGNDSESRENIIENIAPHIKRRVNLDDPDKEIFIERRNAGWFLYFKKEKGAGGLPAGTQGGVLTLISGGIDSPVASHMIARRGAANIWLHFHSFPLVSQKSVEKVRELAREFLRFQPSLKIYFMPFSGIQLKIKLHADPKYRILLYRRAMMKIAERIAQKEHCETLVTGEALGQVGSQTARNLAIIEEVTKIPILRPLIGMDKEEIIERAKKIGTYAISIKPQEDCCTLFIPAHPTAEGKLAEIKKLEQKLKLTTLISGAIKRAEVERI
ncbi:MAG: tRNA 4-thiouridine(8) synthase ThiI [Candidatus Sungbacteria bacterium]|nr:tRNA 4-thiouridine(8) synthase ThiI [Candidatus Sungbacteria bacterium]